MGAQISNSAEVRQSAILGLGVYRPERVVSNAEICETIDSTDEWIQSRSGIKNRRFANADESVLAMAIASGRKALAASGIEPEQVGAVVVATSTYPSQTPQCAAVVADALGTGGRRRSTSPPAVRASATRCRSRPTWSASAPRTTSWSSASSA